ncbi:MAG: AMP-binding protein, partial [Thermoanaerobaculia bacterium]
MDRDSSWSYRELDGWSNRLARWFAQGGAVPGDRIAVWVPKSCRAVAVLQAALRIGAVYVPIDPVTPPLRARKIMDDCDVRLVVTTRGMAAFLPPGRRLFHVDEAGDGRDDWSTLRDYPAGALDGPERAEDSLAYILYTSGSTGTPKGVCVSHGNARAFVDWAVREVGITARAVFANHAPFNFDLSVFDLYGAFSTRSIVCLVPETIAYSAAQLVEFMRANRISVWYSVPSVLMLMMDHGGLFDGAGAVPRIVMFAGEPFPIQYVRTLRKRWPTVRLFNFYGPTETNVCTSYEVRDIPDDQVTPVPIGTAASGDRVWAVKDDGTVAREGENGELWVEGPTVMPGYWGKEPQQGP